LSAAPEPASTESLTVPLTFQEVPYSVINWSLAVSGHAGPFKKEPALGKVTVNRGLLSFPKHKVPRMAFLWDHTHGKLHLDLNRNEDLTDDPTGVFSSAMGSFESSSYRHGAFTNVRLTLPSKAGAQAWRLDLNLSDYRGHVNVYAGVRSLWAGKAVLDGREWQVGLIDLGEDQHVATEGGHLLLRPWSNRNDPFSVYDGSLEAIPFARKVFIQKRGYEVDCAVSPDGDHGRYELKLKEEAMELGELKFTGDFIRRVQLSDGPWVVLLDEPAGTVRVPVGRYGNWQVRIGSGGVTAHSERSDRNVRKPVIVGKDKPAVLTAGGPLTNSVGFTRRGRRLVLNYRLIGASEETYQLGAGDRSNPPRFAVYQDDKKIASGKFEFG